MTSAQAVFLALHHLPHALEPLKIVCDVSKIQIRVIHMTLKNTIYHFGFRKVSTLIDEHTSKFRF